MDNTSPRVRGRILEHQGDLVRQGSKVVNSVWYGTTTFNQVRRLLWSVLLMTIWTPPSPHFFQKLPNSIQYYISSFYTVTSPPVTMLVVQFGSGLGVTIGEVWVNPWWVGVGEFEEATLEGRDRLVWGSPFGVSPKLTLSPLQDCLPQTHPIPLTKGWLKHSVPTWPDMPL